MHGIANAPDDFGPQYIEIPREANDVESIVRYLIQTLVQSGKLAPQHTDEIILQVLRRESLGSTAVGRGIAIPHAQTDLVHEIYLTAGRCVSPVNWPGTLDGQMVSDVCLAIAPRSSKSSLRVLEMAAEKVRQMKIS